MKAKTIFGLLVLCVMLPLHALFAADIWSANSGNWSDTATWGGTPPSSNDTVWIGWDDAIAIDSSNKVGVVKFDGGGSSVNIYPGGMLEIGDDISWIWRVDHIVKNFDQSMNVLGGSLLVRGEYKLFGGGLAAYSVATNWLNVSDSSLVCIDYLEVGWWADHPAGKSIVRIVGNNASFTVSQNFTMGEYGELSWVAASNGEVSQIHLLRYDGTSTVTLNGSLEVDLSSATVFPNEIILIDNDGINPISGAFDTVNIIGSAEYRLTYAGGDGNDLSLVKGIDFEAWIAGYGLSGSKAEPGSDPDGDGQCNLMEFVGGGNPTNALEAGNYSSLSIGQNSTNAIDIGYARRISDNGLLYNLEQCSDLAIGNWFDIENDYEIGSGVLNSDFDWVTNRVPVAGQAQKFLRLRINKDDAPLYWPGIPLLTFDMAEFGLTELSSEYAFEKSPSVNLVNQVGRSGYNAYLNIAFGDFSSTNDYFQFSVSVFGKLTDAIAAPAELSSNVQGITFRAGSFGVPLNLSVAALNIDGSVIASNNFSIAQGSMDQYSLSFSSADFKKLLFKANGADQNHVDAFTGSLVIDDIYLDDGSSEPFRPSSNDESLLSWLKQCAIRHFLWNYITPDGIHGFVPESHSQPDKISLSGVGFAYANFILAEQEGMISAVDARDKILSMLKWQQEQNWFDGSGGWHGFPHHYFKPDGTYYWADVSTVDWAICAAGIRVVRQRYTGDYDIVSIADELLARPDWNAALASGNKIAMGFDGYTGAMNPWRWGLAYSEETELVYLEAVASGLSPSIFSAITRNKVNGYYPSWYGSGFTYNWLQLWTGIQEPYATNSTMAYNRDAITCQQVFGRPIMGLTACPTLSGVDGSGFISWDNYIGNQGSDTSGATSLEVIQVSPAPYGAILATPFTRSAAIMALGEYLDVGFYHPLLGLPDNVRLSALPSGIDHPVPQWTQVDINLGPCSMAIEAIEGNSIAGYYLSDSSIAASLEALINSFEF